MQLIYACESLTHVVSITETSLDEWRSNLWWSCAIQTNTYWYYGWTLCVDLILTLPLKSHGFRLVAKQAPPFKPCPGDSAYRIAYLHRLVAEHSVPCLNVAEFRLSLIRTIPTEGFGKTPLIPCSDSHTHWSEMGWKKKPVLCSKRPVGVFKVFFPQQTIQPWASSHPGESTEPSRRRAKPEKEW